ncbi:hypothetical protein SNE40_005898 [Patella caerulea]|uniref:Uncharacterized protein n=1 Tax=Patella caerulea TaxID=87958 RepID=A0AAN8K6Y1_PATCE
MAEMLIYSVKGRLFQSPLDVLLKVIYHWKIPVGDKPTPNWLEAQKIISEFLDAEGEDGDDQTIYNELDNFLPSFYLVPKPATDSETAEETVVSQPSNISSSSNEFKSQVPESNLSSSNSTSSNSTSSNSASSNPTSSTMLTSSLLRKDFKINGSISYDGKNCLSFVSLIRQIEAGVKKGFTEIEIIEGVIKTITPGCQLKLYLEGRTNLTLSSLRRLLRSHFHEKTATELYQDLGSTYQQKEEPTDFLLRLLALKQKILFVSQEESDEIKYDPKLVNEMFKRTFYTGLLSETIRREIQPVLESNSDEEELIQSLSDIVSREKERKIKMNANQFKPKIHAAQVSTEKEEKNKQVKPGLASELNELKAEVAALTNIIKSQTFNPSNRPNYTRPFGCKNCQVAGTGNSCRHCWLCGSTEHYKSFHSQKSGNDTGSPRWGRK